MKLDAEMLPFEPVNTQGNGGAPQQPPSAFEENDDRIDVGEYFATLFENKWLIVAVTLMAILGGAAVAFLVKPGYRADALLQVEETVGGFAALEELQPLIEQTSPVSAELEILRSRMILGKVVDTLKLDQRARPLYFPVIGEAVARRFSGEGVAKPWIGKNENAWGGEAIQMERLEVPNSLIGVPLTLVAGVEGEYVLFGPDDEWSQRGSVGEPFVREFDTTKPLRLFVSRLKARPGTQFVLLRLRRVDAINELAKKLSIAEKGRGSGIVNVSFTGSNKDLLPTVLDEITTVYVRQNVERRSAEAENTLRFLEAQLPALKEQLDSAEAAYNSFRLEEGSVDLTSETQTVLRSVVDIDNQLVGLQHDRLELRQRFKPEHPRMKAVDSKISQLRRNRLKFEGQVAKLPNTQQKILRLRRDVEVNTGLYTQLLNTAQELRIAKAGTIGNARIIDSAEVDLEPIRPRKGRIFAASAVLGLLTSFLLIWLFRNLRVTVDDPEKIERGLGLPVFATVPHSVFEQKLSAKIKHGNRMPGLLATDSPEDDAVESLRGLRTTLHFALVDAPMGGVVITGPSQGIGKSFLSKNLAAVLAQTPAHVAIVDADLRRGHLHREFGIERGPGLADFLSGKVQMQEIVQRTPVEGLDAITTGERPSNPSELLMHSRFDVLMKLLLKSYDHVIVDAPPVLAVSDAAIIGRYVGSTIMVAKAGQHPLRELEESVKRLRQAGVGVRGFVLNDLDTLRLRYRYGYKGYHYHYKYK